MTVKNDGNTTSAVKRWLCDEIIALTKMNWNNTQFDRQMPITIECARNVGEILKYLDPDDEMQLKYSFYM